MKLSLSNLRITPLLRKLKKFDFELWYQRQKFDQKKQLEFLTYFATWLPSGSIAACNAIIDTGANVPSRKLDVIAAKTIKSSLERGSHVSEGLAQMFSPEVVLLFKAAQESNKPNAMNHILQSYIRQENDIKQRKSLLLKSLMYPSLLIGMSLLLNAGIAAFLTQVAQSAGSSNFSTMGQLTLSLGSFVTNYIGFAALMSFALFIFVSWVAKNYVGQYRPLIDKVFPMSLFKAFAVMRSLRILGLLIEYKSSVPQALSVLAANSNPYVKHQLKTMFNRVSRSGLAVHVAMNTGFLPSELVYRLKMQMDHKDQSVREAAISHVADFAGLETERKFNTLSKRLVLFSYGVGIALLIAGFGGYFEVMNLINNASNQNY